MPAISALLNPTASVARMERSEIRGQASSPNPALRFAPYGLLMDCFGAPILAMPLLYPGHLLHNRAREKH